MIRESQPRLVTGEILAADRARPEHDGRDRNRDFEDADFETVTPGAGQAGAKRETPGHGRESPVRPQPAAGGETANLSVLRGSADGTGAGIVSHFRQAGGPMFWGTALVLVASAFWISGGHALLTGRGGEAADEALFISDVQTRLDTSAAPAVMLVDATVENRGLSGHPVPEVIIDVEASDGTSRRFRLSSEADNLAPGARRLFSGRIPALRNGVDSVSVKLGNRDDS